jgi:hypothetical protein
VRKHNIDGKPTATTLRIRLGQRRSHVHLASEILQGSALCMGAADQMPRDKMRCGGAHGKAAWDKKRRLPSVEEDLHAFPAGPWGPTNGHGILPTSMDWAQGRQGHVRSYQSGPAVTAITEHKASLQPAVSRRDAADDSR